jgi:hypothetical protein
MLVELHLETGLTISTVQTSMGSDTQGEEASFVSVYSCGNCAVIESHSPIAE